MKKWLLMVTVLLLIAMACIYIFIPSRLHITRNEEVQVNAKAFIRNLSDTAQWKKWWFTISDDSLTNSHTGPLVLNKRTYIVNEERQTSLVITIAGDNDSLKTELVFVPLADDSVFLTWSAALPASNNPITRLHNYFKAQALAKDMDDVLQKLKQYYQNDKHLYTAGITKTFVTDSILISTSTSLTNYPATETIYKLIDKLQTYAAKNDAKQTGLPMVNIFTSDSVLFKLQVALPVDKRLKDAEEIAYRWMLGGGNILLTEVTGGPYTINTAFAQMEKYVQEYKRLAPAIPFQSLVTDRRKEPDTAKWITKLYWPVM